MAGSGRTDSWGSGDAYEPYVGRWSRRVAERFLDWLAIAPGRRWLDVGCGTGAVSQTILERCAPERVIAVDPSDAYLAHARGRLGDDRIEFRKGSAEALPAEDGTAAAVVSGLVLNFVPDQAAALAEMRRAVEPGGTVAVYVWDYAGEMQLMRRFWDAAVALDPAASELDEGRRFPVCRPDALADLFTGAGFDDVETRPIQIPTVFRDFDDYWTPFLGGQGPAPGYCVSLPEERRAELRERIRATLPTEPDGAIPLIARAWAARATAPR